MTLAYIDLDNFKSINDLMGHDEGDRVLVSVGRVLQHLTRRTDFVGRLGGDEFTVLLIGADEEAAQQFILKIRKALSDAFAGHALLVTCSMGCTVFVGAVVDASGAIKAADSLMYQGKALGKDNVVFGLHAPSPE